MTLGKDFFFIARLIKALFEFFVEFFGDEEDKIKANHYGIIPPYTPKKKDV